MKTTALVDTATQAILDVHCTTTKRHDTQIGWQVARRNAVDLRSLAADMGYDWMALRENLREKGMRPLIKHRLFQPVDHAHTRGSTGLGIASEPCVRPSSPRSSARLAPSCVRGPGTVSSVKWR